MKQFFARLNPMERRFVVGVGVAFFLVANFVFIFPRFADWGATRTAMDDAQRKISLFQQGISQKPAIELAIARFQNQSQIVPQEEQAVQFFRLIQNQAAASGVGIISMGSTRQSINTNNPFFVEQNQTITTQSGEKQMVDFLYNLGSGTSLIRVKNLSIQPDPPRQQLSGRVTLVASYQKKLPTAGAASPAAPKGAAPANAKATTPGPTPQATTPKPVNPAASGAASGAAPKPPPPNPAGAPRPPFPVPINHAATNKPNPLTPNKK